MTRTLPGLIVLMALAALYIPPVAAGSEAIEESAQISPCEDDISFITIEAFLTHIKDVHPLFEKEQYTAQILQEEQNGYLGGQDWLVNGTVDYSYYERTYAQLGPDITTTLAGNATIQRHLWATGGSFFASADVAYVDQSPYSIFPQNFYQNQLTLGYSHPLIKNKGGLLDRFPFLSKEYEIANAEVRALENQEAFLVSCAEKYIDWVSLSDQIKVNEERLHLSEQELESSKKKREAYLVDTVDVLRAEDAVRIARQKVAFVRLQMEALRSELAVLALDMDLSNTTPCFDLFQFKPLPDSQFKEGCSRILKQSRILGPLQIMVRQLEFSQLKFDEELKPDLSAFSQLSMKNADNNLLEGMFLDEPDVRVGLMFSVPIERRTARSQLRQIDLQTHQIQKQIEEVSLNLLAAFTNLHVQLTQLMAVLELNREQIESARVKTLEEMRMYNHGRSQMTFVIQGRDNELNAKLVYIQNAALYQKLMVHYHALLDEILDSNDRVAEGIWQ